MQMVADEHGLALTGEMASAGSGPVENREAATEQHGEIVLLPRPMDKGKVVYTRGRRENCITYMYM